ncbi:MAG: phosphotransferase [Deltaproteobacteria bacterium]|jgi:hypothetical protein
MARREVIDATTLAWVRDCTGASDVYAPAFLQRLWAGYGAIHRVHLDGAPYGSAIVKVVTPPLDASHPRGWGTDRSDARKRRSYEVECAWYRTYASRCAGCRVPRCYAAEAFEGGWRILLEDLDAAGFAGRRGRFVDADVEVCLDWLAAFHATFVGVAPEGLWPVGTYWHLATRPDELLVTEDPRLAAAAEAIDARLSSARFTTFVHGDAKLANFCFGEAGVAAVDFQYVGGGCGMKDVAYFLGGAARTDSLEKNADAWLDRYFATLRRHLDPAVDADALEAEWRTLYPFAWADFNRFLSGWAPGHEKLEPYGARLTEQVLQELRVR